MLERLKKSAKYIVGAAVYFALTAVFDLACPIKALTGLNCPTCGVTRSMLALLRLDIAGYLSFNPLALPLCLAVLWIIFRDKFSRRTAGDIMAYGVLAVNLLFYLRYLSDALHPA